ncbi:unnamed protein product [Candidula unifasciata]|uniref:G-protein coupled receptors family 1 profile domain-containing protein n=1 Tax=Candidula unifasciata TaxID=100452 RepID=A0A8S3ZAJ7_9EUPU|nr:unnamed protein product [Candidula unifasciata]
MARLSDISFFHGELTGSDTNYHHRIIRDVYASVNLRNSTLWLNSAIPRYTHASDDTTNPRLVAGIVVLALLGFNVLGNSLVFFIYEFRVKPSVFSFYVKVLAALDISTALTTMLLDVIIKMRPLEESWLDLNSLCKITHFQVYAQSLVSGCVFTLIAYQRYRKICHPLEPGLTIRTARRSLVIISAICIPLTVPTLVINGAQDIQVRVNTSHIVNVTICRNDKRFEGTYYQSVFSIFLLSAFSLVLCLTIIYYAMVAKAVRKFERRSSMLSKPASSPTALDTINKEQGYAVHATVGRHRQSAGRTRLPRLSISGETNDRISIQMYRVFATITIIFIVSYLPHLLVLVLRKSLGLDHQVLTFAERILLDLAYNCPYLSTVANPIVYGYCNAEFRDRLKHIFCCKGTRS